MFPLLAVLVGISALTMSFAGTMSFVRNPSRNEHRWFFISSIALSTWIVANFVGSNVTRPFVTPLFVSLDFIFALISSWLFLQFIAAFIISNPYFHKKKKIIAYTPIFRLATGIIVVVLCVGIVQGFVVHVTLTSDRLVVKNLGGYAVYVMTIVALMLNSIQILLSGYKEIGKKDRQGLEIILVGLIIMSVSNIASNILAPSLIHNRQVVQQLNIFGYLGMAALVLSIYIAITTKKLFDIRGSAIRGATYLFTLSMASIVYIAPIVYIVGVVLLGLPFVWYKFVLIVVVGTIVALYFNRIKSVFDRITRRFFFQDSLEPAEMIGELNKLLVSSSRLNEMTTRTVDLIKRNFQTDYCAFILKDAATDKIDPTALPHLGSVYKNTGVEALVSGKYVPTGSVIDVDRAADMPEPVKKALLKDGISVIVRLADSGSKSRSSMGYMLLGYKKNGNLYLTRDFMTLEAMANVLVIAIQNALRFEEIQDFNLTLQQRIYEATSQLRRTNAKLKALDETKDDFISMASHQLRTPLTSVKGYLSMVLEGDAGKITPMQRKMLDQAFVSSQRMVFLIADLLNVSRLKTGKFVIEPSPVNLARTVADEIDQLKETAKTRELELMYEKPAEFPTLMIDETKIRQVIMNFIDNAIYYTPKGGKISVELRDTPSTVELRVVDNGIGVPKREQPHLFTKFYRAGNARQTRPDGTGLGLFMAKKVVVAQGGAVIFDSEEGKGSTFGFIFPKARLTAAPPAPQAQALHR